MMKTEWKKIRKRINTKWIKILKNKKKRREKKKF